MRERPQRRRVAGDVCPERYWGGGNTRKRGIRRGFSRSKSHPFLEGRPGMKGRRRGKESGTSCRRGRQKTVNRSLGVLRSALIPKFMLCKRV